MTSYSVSAASSLRPRMDAASSSSSWIRTFHRSNSAHHSYEGGGGLEGVGAGKEA